MDQPQNDQKSGGNGESAHKSGHSEIANCAKCGGFGSQSMDVVTDRHGLILSRQYYMHCFDGDCGAEGPKHAVSDESIRLWNEQQRSVTP